MANGDVSTALSVATIFAQTFGEAAPDASLCQADSPTAAVREQILATMLQLDAVTYSSSTYILQARLNLPPSKRTAGCPSRLLP